MFTELQEGIKAYLEQRQYDKALSKWELVQKSIEKLPSLGLQEHIRQAHALAEHFLATQQATKADDLYERLKKACLQLDQFSILEQVQFYQAVASNYEAHVKYNEALTYCTQALYLVEQGKQTDFINLFTDKLNQLHHKLLVQLITPYVQQQIETAKSRLHVTKQRSLEEFITASDNFLLLANALQQEQQWELAINCYETVVSNAERLAQTYDAQPLIAKITELSRYDRGETKPTELSRWQAYRQQLHALRERFPKQLAIQLVLTVQAIFSRDLKKLLADVLKQIESLLGEKPCAFSIVVLGSLAREDASPYSDIDFAILVSDESKRHDDYFQTLIKLFSLTINLIGEPNGLRIDSGDFGYLSGADKLFLTTPEKLAKRFSPAKFQEILNQPETHALHRPALLYASMGGENLLTDYQRHLQNEWPTYRAQWVSGYARLHYDAWQVLAKKINDKSTVDLKENYLRPLLLWCTDIALHAGIEVASVRELLQTLAINQVLDADFLKELTVAFETVQKLRVELQLKSHAQEEKLDIFKNMNTSLELERIHSQVLVPAYETLQRLEKPLKQFDPVTESLLQIVTPLSNPVAITSSSSSTSSFFSKKITTPEVAEQALQTFIDVMLVRGGKPSEQRNKHREMFSKLSPKLRVFYLKQLEISISNAIQAKKLDQTVANYILQGVCMYPDAAGLRKISEQQMTVWETTLFNLTEPVSQNFQSTLVTLEWFNSRGQKEKRILKLYYVDQIWGSQGKLGGHDQLSDGRRLVRPLQDQSGKLVAYVKVYPELPGIQLSVNSLVQHVSGEGMKSIVVKATAVTGKSTITYPLLLSEPVPGKTLQQVLREKGNINDIETNMDAKSFTLKVFESLLINPEDDKADNLVAEPVTDFEGNTHYRIESVDSDHAYVDPLVQAGTVINRQEKVQVKSILYCMGAMLQALDPEAIQEFLLLDPFQTLNDWLSGLHVYNQRYVGNRELNQTGLFTETEIQNYVEGKDFCFVQTFFEPGWVVAMYEKFLQLQAALRENPPNNHLELLTLIEPRLALHYEKVFAEHKMAHERFQALPTEYVTVAEKQTNTVRYQSTLKTREKVLKSITIMDQKKKKDLKNALKEGSLFTPDKAQKAELQMIHTRYQQLHEIRNKVMQGSVNVFAQLEYGDFFKEKVINSLDFSKMSEALAISLLQSLPNISFFSLSLVGCRYLTDTLLKLILKGSPNLRELDVCDCVQLTDASFYTIAKQCKYLVKLTMANTGLKVIEGGLGRTVQFNLLRKLRLRNCKELTTLTIDASQLEELQVSGCRRLAKLKFKATPPKLLNIQDCTELEAQKPKGTEELIVAVRQINLGKVQSVLASHAYCVNELDATGYMTPLQMASTHESETIMEVLIKSGANVNHIMKSGASLLHLIVWNDTVKALKILLKAGCEVNPIDNNGSTPLHSAAQQGKIEMVQILLKAGAKVNQVDKDGASPLCLAADNGHIEVVKILFAYQANKDHKTLLSTAFEFATKNKYRAAINLLKVESTSIVAIESKALQQGHRRLEMDSFATTYTGLWNDFTEVAIKEFITTHNFVEKIFEEVGREAQLMANLCSPRIVRLYGVCFEAPIRFVMEYMPNGSLWALLHSEEEIQWPQRIRIAMDVGEGLHFLHVQNPMILHRDIKSLNVLLDANFRAKLTGFDLAQVIRQTSSAEPQESQTNSVGTIIWMAPELFGDKREYSVASDVYAYGMVLWEIASRKIPFQDIANSSLISTRVREGEGEDIPAETPIKYSQLITKCWDGNKEARPKVKELLIELKEMASESNLSQKNSSDKNQRPVVNFSNNYLKNTAAKQQEFRHEVDGQTKERPSIVAIESNTLQVQGYIGSGSISTIYFGLWNDFTEVAIKKIEVSSLLPEAIEKESKNEAYVMANLHSPRIVQLYGVCFEPSLRCLVMEYMPKGSLFDFLRSKEAIQWPQRIQIAMDVGEGLHFLHIQNPMVLHRDIKSSNVLLDDNFRAKLAGFTLAQVVLPPSSIEPEDAQTEPVGAIRWMAPELFGLKSEYSAASDVYAYGIVLWEIASRKIPYQDVIDSSLILSLPKHGEHHEEIPAETPPKYSVLIQRCWDGRREQRPAMKEVLTELKTLGDSANPTSSTISVDSIKNTSHASRIMSGVFSPFSENENLASETTAATSRNIEDAGSIPPQKKLSK
jgi:serine/threonine protein kinase/ankyrin repeat protein/predicted nucleotidyltransferase